MRTLLFVVFLNLGQKSLAQISERDFTLVFEGISDTATQISNKQLSSIRTVQANFSWLRVVSFMFFYGSARVNSTQCTWVQVCHTDTICSDVRTVLQKNLDSVRVTFDAIVVNKQGKKKSIARSFLVR